MLVNGFEGLEEVGLLAVLLSDDKNASNGWVREMAYWDREKGPIRGQCSLG